MLLPLQARQLDIYIWKPSLYTVKKVIEFPLPSRDVNNQTIPGRE